MWGASVRQRSSPLQFGVNTSSRRTRGTSRGERKAVLEKHPAPQHIPTGCSREEESAGLSLPRAYPMAGGVADLRLPWDQKHKVCECVFKGRHRAAYLYTSKKS